MTPRRTLERVLAVYTFLYVAFGLIVLFGEAHVYALLDAQQALLGLGHASGGAPPVALWKYVALGLILVLALFSLWSRRDVERGRPLLHLMIYAKFFSGALMVGHFALAGGQTAFLLGGLSDIAMGLGVWLPLARVFPSTNRDLLSLRMP